MHSTSTLLIGIAITIALSSCRKNEGDAVTPDNDHNAALDNYKAEFFFADALKQADIAYKDGEVGCIASVMLDLDSLPYSMIVDFGTENCMGPDGLLRRGQLHVSFTGAYGDEGTQITITPQGFHVNDHLVQGVKTVTNAGLNDQGQSYFNVTVNGTVTAPDGSWTSTHKYQRTRTWLAGEGRLTIFDDVYLITGGGSGVDRNGLPFTVNITSPLRVEVGCPWIVSGVQEIAPQGLQTRVIDFGNGSCDQQVSITVGNFTFTIG